MSIARFWRQLSAIALLAPATALALDVGANIGSDQTWRRIDSPVNVSNVLTVARNARLTIEPGVTIRFASDAGLVVIGDILAKGTPADRIVFTASSGDTPGSWGGIYLRSAISDTAYDNTGRANGRGSCLDYCDIEFAGAPGVEDGCALSVKSAAPLISNSTIRNSTGISGVVKASNSSQPMFIGCSFDQNHAARGGAFSSGTGAKPFVKDCRFVGNRADDNGGAVYVSVAELTLDKCLFSGNEAGANGGAIFIASSPEISITNSAFNGNSEAGTSAEVFITKDVKATLTGNSFDGVGMLVYLQKAGLPVDASSNWWGGAPDDFDLPDAIHDRGDDQSEPVVSTTNPLWAPNPLVPSIPTSITSIILCRNDEYATEIPRGVAEGAPLRIKLIAPDADPGFPNVIPVKIVSQLDPAGIDVPLTETESSSGVFTGRAVVQSASSQKDYTIGERVGGAITIFCPAHPDVKATYKMQPPEPVASDLTIPGAKDVMHLTTHEPTFSWTYYDVVDRPQQSVKIEVASNDGSNSWSTGAIPLGEAQIGYQGSHLEEGKTYTASLTVFNGKLWSLPTALSFRMNSVPNAPALVQPLEGSVAQTRTPLLTANTSIDPEGDPLAYRVEVSEGGTLVQHTEELKASGSQVVWTPQPLTENGEFAFRFQAADPYESGDWSNQRYFYVNSIEEAPGAFTLNSPVNGDVYDLHPALSWSGSVDPDPLSTVFYSVEVAKAGNWPAAKVYGNIGSNLFVIPDSLENRAEYSWRVTAIDNTGRKTISTNIGKFRVETTPSIPAISAPLTTSDERKPEASLSWQASSDPNPSDVITYEVEVFAVGGENRPLATMTGWSSTSITMNSLRGWEGLSDNTRYNWHVRARDNHNAVSDFSKSGSFFFNKTNDIPAMPAAVTAPGDTIKGTTNVSFGWKPGADADLSDSLATLTYEVEAVVGNFEGGDVHKFRSAPGATSLTAQLDDNRMWNYRVRTLDDDGAASGWATARKVLVNVQEDAPSSVSLQSPANGAAIAELDSLSFSWSSAADPDWASSVRYRFELKGGDGKVIQKETGQTSITIKGPLANEASYGWKVTAVDNTGLTTGSQSEFNFSTSTTPTAPGTPSIPMELLANGRFEFGQASDPNPRDRLTYTIEVASDEAFSNVIARKEGASAGVSVTIAISELTGRDKMQNDADYFVRARAIDNHGFKGSYCSSAKFRYNPVNDVPTTPVEPLAPSDGKVVAEQSPTLSWSASSDKDLTDPPSSLVYELKLDSDGELTKNSTYTFTTGSGATSFRLPVMLADNAPWVWAVRAKDDEGAASPWTQQQSFLVNVREDSPTAPNLTKPYSGQTLNTLGPITLAWSRSYDSDYKSSIKYRIAYGTDSGLSGATSVDQSDSTLTVKGPLENTTYYWRVTAIDNTGLETASSLSSFAIDTRPSTPFPSAPAGGVELKGDGKFGWTESTDPTPKDVVTYTLQIAGDATFGDVVLEAKGVKQVGVSLNGLPDKGKALAENSRYFWRVKAVDSHGIESSWSSAADFILNAKNDPPTTFSLSNPSDGSSQAAGAATFGWQASNDPDPNSRVMYTLLIASDAKFKKIVGQFGSLSNTEMTLPAGSLQPGLKYYWRVSAEDGLGGVAYGSGSDKNPWTVSIEAPPPPPVPGK